MPEKASGPSDDKAREQTRRIDEQLNDSSWRELCLFAKRRCASLGRLGVRLDSETPEDLVAAAIADTATGRLTWPARKTLVQHVRDTVLSRTSHEMNRQRLVRFVSLTRLSPESPRLASGSATDRIVEARRDLLDLVSELAAQSRDDPLALNILACQLNGVLGRKETADLLGVTVEDYDRAQHRLRRRQAKLTNGEPR